MNICEAVISLRASQNSVIKIFHASTSEMYGVVKSTTSLNSTTLNEESIMDPVSPYALSKLTCYHICQYYRISFNLDIRQAISFNHESPFRNELFVTRKITLHIAKHGDNKPLKLGNVDAIRDWGHAKDFVYAYWLIMKSNTLDDKLAVFVVSTG